MTSTDGRPRADVELRLPADGAYASLLRTTTAGLAARLDFTIDDIEDLRIAASEAGALVLPEAEAGTDLLCEYFLQPGRLTLRLSVRAASPGVPDRDSFGWQVLSTLATAATAETTADRLTVSVTMESALATPRDARAPG
ncbi:MAG TPA: anti-sigma factor [Nocardioides sp.]|uniref:anti-sigma factor n=1 Tax=Nocardioides sp. TaxID=35761 RepID=UPI002C1677BE|nr:anti-sigma factor [Nocardioides sp.]HQR26279.1 anti-sigma factor [Nocardioides sp.]